MEKIKKLTIGGEGRLLESSKNEVINLMKNIEFTETENIIKHKNLLPHIKNSKKILTFRDIETEKK